MTPQDKATELIEKFYGNKESALKAVSEILNLEPPELSYLETFSKSWWQEVNQILKNTKQ